MRIRSRLIAMLAVGAAAVLPGSSVTAQTPGVPGMKMGSGISVNDIGGHQLIGEGQYEGVVSSAGYTEAFTCVAEATPDALATEVSSCTLNTASAPPLAVPAPVATTSSAVSWDASTFTAPVQLCWTVAAIYADITLGPAYLTSSGCTTVGLVPLSSVLALGQHAVTGGASSLPLAAGQVAFECHWLSHPDAIAFIASCGLKTSAGVTTYSTVTDDEPAGADVGVAAVPAGMTYTVCLDAAALYPETLLGPQWVDYSVCS